MLHRNGVVAEVGALADRGPKIRHATRLGCPIYYGTREKPGEAITNHVRTLLTSAFVVSAAAACADEPAAPRIRTATFAKDTCRVIAEEASRNELPSSFFARLVWRESLFNPSAVSRKGAQGIAQFLPATAAERGLANPFDPATSLVASAGYLASLRARFGSIGLAAAAYNAGPNRVDAWRKGTGTLPLETQDYVLWITGHSVEDWSAAKRDLTLLPIADGLSFSAACEKLAARGLDAKLPDRPLRAAAWQKLFIKGLGITQVKASRPGRIRVVIDVGPAGRKQAPADRTRPRR